MFLSLLCVIEFVDIQLRACVYFTRIHTSGGKDPATLTTSMDCEPRHEIGQEAGVEVVDGVADGLQQSLQQRGSWRLPTLDPPKAAEETALLAEEVQVLDEVEAGLVRLLRRHTEQEVGSLQAALRCGVLIRNPFPLFKIPDPSPKPDITQSGFKKRNPPSRGGRQALQRTSGPFSEQIVESSAGSGSCSRLDQPLEATRQTQTSHSPDHWGWKKGDSKLHFKQ